MIAKYLGRKIKVCKETSLYGGSFNYDLTVYEPEKLQRFLDEINKQTNPVLLDIGASTGSYSMLGLFNKSLKVWSFEPCEKTNLALNKNLLNNGLTHSRAYHMAISDEHNPRGTFNEVIPDGSKALSMLGGLPAKHKDIKKTIVPVTRIDDFCHVMEVIPTAIKIDTEGNELNVLKGGHKTIKEHMPIILVEYSQENCNQYGYHKRLIKKFIQQFDYNIEQIDNDLLCTQR
jgi:FkbM family methyltransferase